MMKNKVKLFIFKLCLAKRILILSNGHHSRAWIESSKDVEMR